jgi:hypothetical protein
MSLIGQQVFVSPGQVFQGIGGGGGGTSTFQTINFSGALNFDDPATAVIQDIQFTSFDSVPTSVSTNSIQINSPAGSAASLLLAAGNDSQGYIQVNQAGDQTQPLALQILSPTYISSLNVSSINGATPGGGVAPGADLTGISTISVSSMTVTNGILAAGGVAMSNTTIQFDLVGQAIQYYNAGDSNLYIQGLSTHSVQIGTAAAPNQIQVSDTGLFATNVFGVSTLNGSQPTTKASYQVSTLTAGLTYIPENNVAWPLSGEIPVTAGHAYRISGNLALSNAGGVGHTTIAVSGGGAGFPQFVHSYPNSLASPGNNGLAGGIAGIVTPNATPLQIVGFNSDPTNSTAMEFYYLNWLVEDLGTNL